MSIFDIDWNNDGTVDYKDTVIDSLILDELEEDDEKDSFDWSDDSDDDDFWFCKKTIVHPTKMSCPILWDRTFSIQE